MIYYEYQTKNGDVLASTLTYCPVWSLIQDNNEKNFKSIVNGHKVRSGYRETDSLSIRLLGINEVDLYNSTKIFNKTLDAYEAALVNLYQYYLSQIDSHAHTLITIKAQMEQKFEGYIKQTEFYADNYSQLIDKVKNKIIDAPEKAADLICYLKKRVTDLDANMLGYEVLNSVSYSDIELSNVSLKRAILNLYSPFEKALTDKNVSLQIYFDEGTSVMVDRKLFSLIMYNFFDNARKYTKPGSIIRLRFDDQKRELKISMKSLKIEREELSRIHHRGERGQHAMSIAGNGIGMYVIRKCLSYMGMTIYISPDYTNYETDEGQTFVENNFVFRDFS